MGPGNGHSVEGHVEIVDPAGARKDIREAWRDLAIARENPFLTPEWLEAWPRDGERPHVLLWREREGEEVRGVLPLVAVRRGPLRVLRYPGSANGDWFGAACRPRDEPAATVAWLHHLRSEADEWDVLWLDRIEGAATWRQAIAATWGEASVRVPRPPDVLPYATLGEEGYAGWLASRSRNFRSQLGRRRRRAEGEHELRFHDTPGPDGLAAAIDVLFELHDARRVDAGGDGRLTGGARDAYRRFAEAALERGWLRMHCLDVDGEPAAAWYGWRLGPRYCYGISGFDPSRSGLAVGTLLLTHTIERAAEEGASVYDLLWGDETYKARYETGRRGVETLALASGRRGRAGLAAEAAARKVAMRVPRGARARLRRARAGAGSGQ